MSVPITPKRSTILVVDDDPKIVTMISRYLDHAGFDVVSASDGAEALSVAREVKPALVILDWMLPSVDGLTVCRSLREQSDVSVIMLSAKTTEPDRLAGLDHGADDYVVKPFSPRELVARVRAVLRRTSARADVTTPIAFGGLTLDPTTRDVSLDGRAVELTAAEFRLLYVFARTPGRVYTRRELVDAVFGWDSESDERSIDVHIKNIRRKLDPHRTGATVLETVFGVGYKLARPRRDA